MRSPTTRQTITAMTTGMTITPTARRRSVPIDVAAWGAGALGVALGLVVTIAFVMSTGPVATT